MISDIKKQEDLHQNFEMDNDLFSEYQDRYMLLNLNSPIKNELVVLEQNLKNHRSNQLFTKIQKENKNFYKIKSLEAIIKQSLSADSVAQFFNQTKIWQEFVEQKPDEIKSFFIDMDCQFLMVPKKLINFILMQRLMKILRRMIALITP